MVNSAPSVSVVIVSYQTGESLRFCVDSILQQSNLADVNVVDNGNPQEMSEWLRSMEIEQPKLNVIAGHGNIGFAKGCNLGAAAAKGDVVLFLNPDSLLAEDGIGQIQQAFADDDAVWAVGGCLRNPDGSEQRGSRRNLLTPRTAINGMLHLDTLLGYMPLNLHKQPLPEAPIKVDAVSGACIAIRKERFTEIGGFDENYFLHVEDMDICRRIQDAGGEILFLPKLDILHLQGSSRASKWFVEWRKAKGFIYYFRQNESLVMASLMAVLALLNFAIKAACIGIKRLLPMQEDTLYAKRRLIWLHRFMRSEDGQKPNALFEGKTVLVTGATSQVGIATLGHLLAAGSKVVALTHDTKVFYDHPNLHWVSGDLQKGKLDLGDHQPETVIHCAPIWLLKHSLSTMFNAKIKRIIAFSSTSVFVKIYSGNSGERDTVRRLEEAELHLAERCQKAGASFTILRPTMIYGLGLDANVTQISDFAQRYHFFPIYPPADGRRMPVHAEDLAQMAIKVITNKRTFNKSYNIGGGEVLSYRAMVERIFLAHGQTPRTVELKFLPLVLDIVGKWLLGGRMNGEMARRMNEDMVFVEEETQRDFAFKPRGFLTQGKQDLGG